MGSDPHMIINSSEKVLKVLITGMSGTGKSTVLMQLRERGHVIVDTDSDQWCCWVTLPDGSMDWVWREDDMYRLLKGHNKGKLFVSGCKSNQGKFYPLFDHVVLLTAPTDVILERIHQRNTNNYGKNREERDLILRHILEVEPLLRTTASKVIDTTVPVSEVVRQLELLD